jgi:hypothetical protein
MEREYACYCGLCCGTCAVKMRVEPAAKVLYDEMSKLGFGEIMSFFPDGEKFWSFLKGMTSKGVCVSCKAGSGNPACEIRLCAKERNVAMCAFCDNYPCDKLANLFKGYPMLNHDNSVLRKEGWVEWEKIQDERRAKGTGMAYAEGGEERVEKANGNEKE